MTARTAWPQRFGTLTKLVVKQGRSGRYGLIEVNCKSFTQTAFVFNEAVLDRIIAAGEGASVWMKGPIEPVQRRNADGKTYSEDAYKVVYFKDKTPRGDAADASSNEAIPDGAAEAA